MNVGAQLRQARESSGLSIEALAATTRIKPGILEGLERNDLTVVPPHPYDRGFVAAFAREVGLDPGETVREYFAQFAQPFTAPDPHRPASSMPPLLRQWQGWTPAAAAAGLVLLIGLLMTDTTDAPRQSEPLAVGTSGFVAQGSAPGAAASTGRGDAVRASDVNLPSGMVTVRLEVERPSWVTATVDGVRELYQIVPAGTKKTLRGRVIAIRVGDAGAIRWSVNGRAPTLMGAPGAVRTARLTAQDLPAGK